MEKASQNNVEDIADEEHVESEGVLEVEDSMSNNISDETPYIGKMLEIRDEDYVWSKARVLEIQEGRRGLNVKVRFDGWGESYDETVAWKSERLAKLYTFTKEVKCFLHCLPNKKSKPTRRELEQLPPKARKVYSNLWPCLVQFRMPHPVVMGEEDEARCLRAKDLLCWEKNAYFRPYAPHLLPKHNRNLLDADEGIWNKCKLLKVWTEDPNLLGILPPNFLEAYRVAQEDALVKGVAVPGAIETGSLLKSRYLIHSRKGADTRDGCLIEATDIPTNIPIAVERDNKQKHNKEKEQKPPAVVQIQKSTAEEASDMETSTESELSNMCPKYVPRPTLPPGISISEPIYHGAGVKRCALSNKWVASVSMGGNDVFLGSFPTQTQAYESTRLTEGQEIEVDNVTSRAADLHAVPVETIIDAVEKHWNPAIHTFTVHNWSVDMARRRMYVNRLLAWKEQEDARKPDANSPDTGISITCPVCDERIDVPPTFDVDEYLSRHVDECQRRVRRPGRRGRRHDPINEETRDTNKVEQPSAPQPRSIQQTTKHQRKGLPRAPQGSAKKRKGTPRKMDVSTGHYLTSKKIHKGV